MAVASSVPAAINPSGRPRYRCPVRATGLAALVSVLALAATAGGATVPADLVPSRLTLQVADLPAARIDSQGPLHERGYAGAYQRTFVYKAPSGRSGFVYVLSEALLANTVAEAGADLDHFRAGLTSKAGRTAYAMAIAKALRVKVSAVRLSSPRTPRVGDHAFELPLSVQLEGRRFFESLLYMQLDRVVNVVVSAGLRSIAPAESRALAATVAGHIADSLKPRSLAVPAVSGDAQLDAVLTATTGDWSGDATFAFQWQRCQDVATSCSDIAGATEQSYTATDADVGFELRVVVTAANRFGTAAVASALTAAVVAPPPPPPPPELRLR